MPTCNQITDDLAELVANDPTAIARHADHLASCDDCRDARHDATELAALTAQAGSDHVLADDLVARVLAAADAAPEAAKPVASPTSAVVTKAPSADVTPINLAPRAKSRVWLYAAGAAALAAGGIGIYATRTRTSEPTKAPVVAKHGTSAGTITTIARAAASAEGGVEVKLGDAWQPLKQGDAIPAGARLRTDERTRAALELADGTKLVLDHRTELAFEAKELRHIRLSAGRIVADVAHVEGRPATVTTPAGMIDVVGTKFIATATDDLTSVQVARGAVKLTSSKGEANQINAGEEGMIDHGAMSVGAAPSIAQELGWAELVPPVAKTSDEVTSGLGALRAYKPGETRDRDWNLALAKHDVKVRIVGPIARTEITETFKNDSDATLEGVYKFPLPPDAQIDGLALDVDGGFVDGAFVDKERGAKIWKGVIDKAAPKPRQQIASNEIIWVDGNWTDPALLDWKRGGRFELKVYPIPAKGQRTIKIAYTQVVTPRGPWRQYVYPLPHSQDGSTVADQMSIDVEVRGATNGLVRAVGYPLTADATRSDVNALTMNQAGFVPRGDLVVDYRATDGDAELRAWTYQGGAAVAPDDKLAQKKDVGIDPKVVDAQRAAAADTRPTAVIALKPVLPRWRESRPHDYLIVVDASQSMVGERFTRAAELASELVDQMDRRDRFSILACDSDCRRMGDLRSPSPSGPADTKKWLAAEQAAGASDLVASLRTAVGDLPTTSDRESWVLYVGDGFASTGFRRTADVESAIADASRGTNVHITTIGIGTDADTTMLAAAARGGGGSYLAWTPGESVGIAAITALESTNGAQLRDAKVELPSGLADVAPTQLATVRSGEEVLIAARVTGEVKGDVVIKGTVGGEAFEQRYPLALTVSSAAGNGFVPRLWASLAIDQLEKTGKGEDRARIVALSQGYGVMSRETSLLVLESQAMFDAFGVDRGSPTMKWTGDDALDEVVAAGTVAVADKTSTSSDRKKDTDAAEAPRDMAKTKAPAPMGAASVTSTPAMPASKPAAEPTMALDEGRAGKRAANGIGAGGGGLGLVGDGFGPGTGMIAMRRTWVKVPSVSAYDGVSDGIKRAIANSEAALAASPNSREKHRALVQALAYAGEIERARDVASRWLDRDKLDPQALGYEADLLGRDGQRELALRTLAGLVDLDADRAELHERMVRTYEVAGRLAQACSHRIALTAIAPTAPTAGAAIRCLRTLGRDRDAELVARSLKDATLRAAAEKAALSAPPPAKTGGDLVVNAHWTNGADLDLSLVTPEGTRVSWMGGRPDVSVADVNSGEREQLALKSLKRGNYLIEITRGGMSIGNVTGTLDITVLGQKKSVPFTLTGSRATVARLAITMQEQLETIHTADMMGRVGFGNIPYMQVRRVMLARSSWLKTCYQNEMQQTGGAPGRMTLTIRIDGNGQTRTTISNNTLSSTMAACVQQQLGTMHVEGAPAGTITVPLTFQP